MDRIWTRTLMTLVVVSAAMLGCDKQKRTDCDAMLEVHSPGRTPAPFSTQQRDEQVAEFKRGLDAWKPLLQSTKDEGMSTRAKAYVADVERVHKQLTDAEFKAPVSEPAAAPSAAPSAAPIDPSDPAAARKAALKEAAEFGLNGLLGNPGAAKLTEASRKAIEAALADLDKSREALFDYCSPDR